MSYSAEWLALREPADAEARSTDLLEPLRAILPERVLIRDLGAGTGAMGRWLAERLPSEQHWVLHDRDPVLLKRAVLPETVSVTRVPGSLPTEFPGTALVTASALLDLLDAATIEAIATGCVAANCPALLTLSVLGSARFEPELALDAQLNEAFNEHQRTHTGLGPDAVEHAVAAFSAHGATVHRAPSPWRLGGEHELTWTWLRGWLAAAVEQCPELSEAAESWARRRFREGFLVTIGHEDLLAVPTMLGRWR